MAVEGARKLFHLPYFMAVMACNTEGERTNYRSERMDRRLGPGRFRAQWQPTSPPRHAEPGSLEHWLTERYCLYSADRRGRLYRAEVHHRMWPLCDAAAEIKDNTVCDAHGIALADPYQPALLHCVRRIDVVGWRTTPVKNACPPR